MSIGTHYITGNGIDIIVDYNEEGEEVLKGIFLHKGLCDLDVIPLRDPWGLVEVLESVLKKVGVPRT